eukprot:403337736
MTSSYQFQSSQGTPSNRSPMNICSPNHSQSLFPNSNKELIVIEDGKYDDNNSKSLLKINDMNNKTHNRRSSSFNLKSKEQQKQNEKFQDTEQSKSQLGLQDDENRTKLIVQSQNNNNGTNQIHNVNIDNQRKSSVTRVSNNQSHLSNSQQQPHSNSNFPDPQLLMIIQILKKNAESRTQVDLMSLMPLVKEQKLFQLQKIQGKDLSDVCEFMTYEFYPMGSLISNYNDNGESLYIIIDGQVDIKIDINRKNNSGKSFLQSDHDIKDFIQDLQLPHQKVQDLRASFQTMDLTALKSTEQQLYSLTRPHLFCALSITKDPKQYKRQFSAVAATDVHLAVFSKKSFERILDRIYKKFVQKEINFIKNVEQFKGLSKRMLTKIFHGLKQHKFKRGQFLFREGEDAEHFYIIKEGELELKKHVYEQKNLNKDYELLQKPSLTKKFNTNFQRVQGFKVTSEISLFMMGSGKMVGDDEIMRGCSKYLTSGICNSQEIRVFSMKKEEFLKLRAQSEEAWQIMCDQSFALSKKLQALYIQKIQNSKEVTNALKDTSDIKQMCDSLMKEMLWAQVPQTIKFYEKKKLEKQQNKNVENLQMNESQYDSSSMQKGEAKETDPQHNSIFHKFCQSNLIKPLWNIWVV